MIRPWSVAVLVATYNRPAGLQRLVKSLNLAYEQYPFRLVVVNNSACDDLTAAELPTVMPCVVAWEPRPGIAAARNRGLALAGDAEAVVFVDDDEYVTAEWLIKLVHYAQVTDADVVAAPVVSEYPEHTPLWIREGGYFDRPARTSGSELEGAGTGNTLLRMRMLSRLADPQFSDAYSLTGGSDWEFFARCKQAGGRLVWYADAPVREVIEDQRLSLRYVVRRGVRTGNNDARMRLTSTARSGLAVLAAKRLVVGIGYVLRDLGRLRLPRRRGVFAVLQAIGMLLALSGLTVSEYDRPGDVHVSS